MLTWLFNCNLHELSFSTYKQMCTVNPYLCMYLIWRKSISGFRQRVDNSLNKVVKTVSNSTTFLISQLRKHWRSVLYVLPVA